jgi:hypothetical protein
MLCSDSVKRLRAPAVMRFLGGASTIADGAIVDPELI